jgi:tetratricopeptide (TPR) repeat protein
LKTDVGKAEEYARRYVEAHRDVGQGWYLLSAALDKRRDMEGEEIESAWNAVELGKGDVPHLHRRRLADALRDSGELAQAEDQYRLMLKGHECVNCWKAYATLLEKMGAARYADAIEAIKKAEGLSSSNKKEAENLSTWRLKLAEAK